MSKFIFSFGDKKTKKISNSRNILGGKGANLAEMARLGLPVPPGFTISTKMCEIFYFFLSPKPNMNYDINYLPILKNL